jgi:hypothetical protein
LNKSRRTTVLIISGAAAALIVGLAISTHLRLSALEPEGHGDESAEQIAQEILTGQPAHSEEEEVEEEGELSEAAVPANNTESSHSESEETPEERAAEGG